MIKIIGINKAISTSKIRKITAIKKNWIENGIRADLLGSNPHSNGEAFSRSINLFFEIANEIIIIRNEIKKIMSLIEKMIIIIYTNY